MIDFLDWRSDISLQQVFAGVDSFSYPHLLDTSNGDLLYVTALKDEKSRAALMLQTANSETCITPSPLSLRTKVNEYGGKPYWVFGDEIIFSNQANQCLYRQTLDHGNASKPIRITPESNANTLSMYTDVNRINQACYLAILECEDLLDHSRENSMCIAALSGDGQLETSTLIHGADFYSNLVVSKNLDRVAWVQWNHPNMPWDQTELWTAKISQKNARVELVDAQRLALPDGASVCQLIFSTQGALFFSADYPGGDHNNDYWNVYCHDFSCSETTQVTDLALEFGYPHWVYGDHRIVRVSESELLTVASAPQGDSLYLIDTKSLEFRLLNTPAQERATIQHLASNENGSFAAVQLGVDESPKLIIAKLSDGPLRSQDRIPARMAPSSLSIAEHLQFETRDGGIAYGFYYPPVNARYQKTLDPAAKPPLIVMVHGGPTARAYGNFDIQKQFWTSRGFALFDVNHRGSSGYGRHYRDALYRHWGELDTSDIIDGIEMLFADHKVDRDRVCIRGKSAGGYAVLRALTEYPEYFKAGACYYGIGNLVTLAEVTHKFEKYYTDRLIGEAFSAESAAQPSSLFQRRSPIHKVSNIKSAMIVFQGLMDKVVPPSVAAEVIDVLKKANVEHAYVEYADEGHGFRQVDNNIDAWGKELAFYRKVLNVKKPLI